MVFQYSWSLPSFVPKPTVGKSGSSTELMKTTTLQWRLQGSVKHSPHCSSLGIRAPTKAIIASVSLLPSEHKDFPEPPPAHAPALHPHLLVEAAGLLRRQGPLEAHLTQEHVQREGAHHETRTEGESGSEGLHAGPAVSPSVVQLGSC
ncbi:hypothetical protein EYF80_008471 [Liparis tanakae]|uniref:Uncharacterized protein n=1 Tax=Liparis tanakae TaxID=230148 RepID=A0A4Z2IU41_9TELE|nr:hypothetical protein EYF80_008471 [Liparis tanakae]